MKTSVPLFLFSFSFTILLFDLQLCFGDVGSEEFKACGVNYNCGDLVNISYPFWGNERQEFCGRREFKLNCKDNKTTTIQMNSMVFNVLNISQLNHRMTIARSDLFDDYCPNNQIEAATLDYSLFTYSSNDLNLSVWYDCPALQGIPRDFTFECGSEGEKRGRANYALEERAMNWSSYMGDCRMKIEVTIMMDVLKEGEMNRTMVVERGVKEGFEVEYGDYHTLACEGCKEYGGACGGNATQQFRCICGTDINPYVCKPPSPPSGARYANVRWKMVIIGSNDIWKKVFIGVGSVFGGIVIMSLIFFIRLRLHKNKHSHASSSILLQNNNSRDRLMKELEKGENYMAVPLFSYQELVQATNKFNPANQLGDDGFGTVYYGKLLDGREFAVKRLFEKNYRKVEHFLNEVEILTRLHHPHLVTLYGCTSQRSHELLLVYEFVPNGTVADHLHGVQARPGELPWLTRLKIAIETASALAFLHASKTIHRDVKTTNILVDNNFDVKVADFGLPRLLQMQATHVSTAPQGTPGYVDPEYYEYYQLTNKSDVFSFGVVLVELISSKAAVDITRHRHEINLSTMAMNKIQNDELHDFVDPCLGFKTDERIRDMISGVAELAFQCLQSVRDTRPSMFEALEILKNIESRSCGKEKAQFPDSAILP
ncbi:unnamed protein product [Citrullus colocynthis]|uniref:non-specific serine/threonine protein kinase n=1 Tax=Citrullus colocynthis TaxID=252529 RepID=A0ABP0XVF0_9ROSI